MAGYTLNPTMFSACTLGNSVYFIEAGLFLTGTK